MLSSSCLSSSKASTLSEASVHLVCSSKAPTLSDGEFDIVKEYLEKRFPKSSALQEVGAPVNKTAAKQKVNLPVAMPSMDKIKPDSNALSQWKQKYTGPYVLSCKLDGVSGLYYSLENSRKLYTRGDGAVGQNWKEVH